MAWEDNLLHFPRQFPVKVYIAGLPDGMIIITCHEEIRDVRRRLETYKRRMHLSKAQDLIILCIVLNSFT